MIRRFPEPALRMLHTFFQTCWTTGNIPKDWKKATVVAIPKNGKPPQQTSSYRPIALTPHLGKVYERVLKNRLDHHLEKNQILPLCQAGFRKGRNCMEHVVRLIEDTKKWSLKGKNKKTVATFFDIKKAFDSVWHAKLLNKMGALGITGRMYNFIQTFLDSREITVKDLLNFSESSEDERNLTDPLGKPISPAVQQGSDKYCSQLVGKENRKKSAVNTLKKEGGVNSEGHAKDVSVIRSAHSKNSVSVVVSPSEESLLPLSESTRLDCPETVQVSKKQSFGHLLAHDNSPCLFDSSLGDSQNSSYEQLKIVEKKEGEKLLIEETRAWNKKDPKTQGLEDAQTLSGLETSEGESQYMTCLATPDVSSMYEVVDISVQTSFNTGASAAADSDTAHATAVPADRPDDRPCSGGDLANSPEFCPDRGTEAAENAKVHCTTMVDLDKPQDRKPASMPVSARKEESCDVDHEPASPLDVWTHTDHSHKKDMKMEANAEHCKEDKEVKMEDIAEQCKEGKETICSKSHHSLEVRSKFPSDSNYFSESQSDVNTTSHGLGVVGNSHGTDGHKTQASLPEEVCSMNVGSSVTGEKDHTTAEHEGRTTHGTRQKSASPESSVFSSRQARRGTDKKNVPGSSLRRSPKRHDDSSSEDDSDGRLEAFFQKMRTPAQPNQKVVKSNHLDEFIVNDSDITDSEENASDEDTDPMEGLCDDFLLESLASTRSAKGVFQAGQPQDTAVDDDVSSGSDDYDVLSDLDDDEDDCLQQLKTPRSKMMPSFSLSQTPREASPEWYTPATSMKTKQHRHRKHSPLDSTSSSVSSSTTSTTGQGRADRGEGDWKTPASSVRPAANRPPSMKTLGFVPSLSSHIPDHLKDGEARSYIVHFKRKQEELSSRLFKLFNFTVFENQLSADLPVVWNKRLLKTAGLCKQKRVNDRYTAVIELSSKVCDTAERVRDTLVHEMCHAAVWILNKAKEGHGPHWKYWARKANRAHPEIPVIRRCHDYSINTKYIYKCEKCGYQIGRHSKSLDTELKVCGHCHGRFQLLPPSRAPSTSTSLSATPRTPAPFALFVKENYGSVKRGGGGLPHKAVMEALSREFAKTKINFS
ncbi:hypothetical protein ACOMHN_040591 [Nucella lapillus]